MAKKRSKQKLSPMHERSVSPPRRKKVDKLKDRILSGQYKIDNFDLVKALIFWR